MWSIIVRALLWILGLPIVSQLFQKFLAIITPVIAMWGFKSVVKRAPEEAANIAKSVSDQYFNMGSPWATFVSKYCETMTGHSIPIEEIIGQPVGSITEGANRAFVDRFFNDMLSMVMPSPEDAEAKPLEGAERYLAANLKFQMDAWWLHVLGDMLSFGIFKSLKDLPNAISWSLGLGWLSWLVMGVPFRIGISGPMERYFNTIYRPTKLTASQLIEALQRGFIDAETFMKQMAEQGYSPDDASILFNNATKEITSSNLKAMYEQGMIEAEQITDHLTSLGYPEEAARALTQLIVNDRFYDLMGKIANQVITLYRKSQLSEDDMVAYLKQAGYKDEEIELVKILGKLQRTEEKDLADSDIPRLYEIGMIDWNQAKKTLTDRGWKEDTAVNYLLLRIDKAKWPAEVKLPVPIPEWAKPFEALPDSDIPRLYINEVITWDQAVEILKTRGYAELGAQWYLALRVPREKWPAAA